MSRPTSRQIRSFVPLCLLSSALFLGGGSVFQQGVAATPGDRPVQELSQASQQPPVIAQRQDALPRSLANQVRQDLARRLGVSTRRLQVVNASRQTWPDACLGLAGADEMCAQMLVEGWRLEVTNGQQTWVYHTDSSGRSLRLSPGDSATAPQTMPRNVRDRILRTASRQSGISASRLRLVDARQRTWNGCLGLDPGPNQACTEIAINGWQVIVASNAAGNSQSWVYHSNHNGSDVRQNAIASLHGSIIPTFMHRTPPAPSPDVVFQASSSGGITGRTTQITLLRNGTVTRSTGTAAPTVIKRLSAAEVQSFEQLLQLQRFGSLNGLNYPAPQGAADYITVTLVGRQGATQYVDFAQNELPIPLQQVIQSWNQVSSSGRG